MPRFSGCEAGNDAQPEKRERYRDPALSARARTSRSAPERMMPWPARMTGRWAWLMRASAASISFWLGKEDRLAAMGLGGRGFPVENAGCLLGVLGDVQEHRAGAVGRRDLKGFAQRRGNVLGARDQVVVLGDRQRDSGDVAFLKSVGADHGAADLAGDANDRGGVHHRRGDPGDHVRGARAGGGYGHSHSSAGAGVAVGHVRGALFVPDQNVVDLGSGQGVVGRQNRAAGIAEYARDIQGFEGLPNDVRARKSLALGCLSVHSGRRSDIRRHPPMTGPRISGQKQGH